MPLVISDPIKHAPVTRAYRHWLAWVLALALHLVVIGVLASWQFATPSPERSSLDVMLVTRASEVPIEAEAIAEADQQAPAATEHATPEAVSHEAAPPATAREVESATPATPQEPPQTTETEPRVAEPSVSGRELLADATRSIREQGLVPTSPGIASAAPRQAAERAAEARYIDDWTRRVERYGNRVHPAPRHLQGQLRIRVVVGRHGELRQAEVVQSSGHSELDQAALDTVHGAAPYRPFDMGMGNLDSLSITRVWRFGQGNHYGVR